MVMFAVFAVLALFCIAGLLWSWNLMKEVRRLQ